MIFLFELACVAEIEPATVAAMKTSTKNLYSSWRTPVFCRPGDCGGHAEQEKAFNRQIQNSNGRQGHSHPRIFPLHTRLRPRGPRVLQNDAVGGSRRENSKIELVSLTPEDVKKATTPMDGPTGKVC